MGAVTFLSWQRRAGNVIGAPIGGRPTGQLTVRATDTAGGDESQTLRFALHGPGDVAGLLPGAVVTRFPRPGQSDAESDYCPYAELAASDLPWRYSPHGVEGTGMRPWLSLLAVRPAEIVARGGGTATIAMAALAAHPATSGTAHVQHDPGRDTARVLCLRPLDSLSDYIALLVPTFAPDGSLAWDGSRDVTLPVYDEWSFRTGEAGTFESLAEALHAADQLADFGRIPVSVGPGADERVAIRGALTGITDATDPAPPAAAAARLAALLAFDPDAGAPGHVPGFDAEGRRYVRPPDYGDAWLANVLAGAPAGGWVAQLNGDPTHRVVAGLGLKAGVDLEDEIVTAAGDRMGAAETANERIAGLVAGLAAARSLWDRRAPADRNRRIMLLGLAAGRILSRGPDGSVAPLLARATGPDRTLPSALFSTAARRILRRGSSRLRHANAGAADVLDAANAPRKTVRRPEDAPGDPRYSDGSTSGDALVAAVTGRLGSFNVIGQDVRHGDDLFGALRNADTDMPQGFRGALGALAGLGAQAGKRDEPRPVDLGGLDDALVAAFNPFGASSAVDRVLAGIAPDDPQPLAPREPCPDLDLPAWRYLRERQREWLLPGAKTLDDGEVVGLATNPVFVDAFLVGLNTQALGEMRWRNLRPATGCTPLRRFWDRSVESGGQYVADTDIVGVAAWVATQGGDRRAIPLGDGGHTPSGGSPRHLVVAFCTDLFRRYPSTLVYLAGPPPPVVPQDADLAARVLPAFVAQITPKLVLFAFAVAPESLEQQWLVVEQQPPGFRFRRSLDPGEPGSPAARAAAMLQRPVRAILAGDSIAAGPA